MFVRWKRRSLSEDGYRRDVCCAHEGNGRETLSPVVTRVQRVPGLGPRQIILWGPAPGIRSCCVTDRTDPIARALWWAEVHSRLEMVRNGTDSNPFSIQVADHLTEILGVLADVVPLPTDREMAIVKAWNELRDMEFPGLYAHEAHRARLREARRLAKSREPRQSDSQQARRPPPRVDRLAALAGLRVLGLSWPCTEMEIVRAYRKGVFSRHPDKGGKAKDFCVWTKAYDNALEFVREQAESSNSLS